MVEISSVFLDIQKQREITLFWTSNEISLLVGEVIIAGLVGGHLKLVMCNILLSLCILEIVFI